MECKYESSDKRRYIPSTVLHVFLLYSCRGNKIIASALAVVVITINVYFVLITVQDKVPKHWAILTLIAIFSIFYVTFCIYLVIHMAIHMGATGLTDYPVSIQRNRTFHHLRILPNRTDMHE